MSDDDDLGDLLNPKIGTDAKPDFSRCAIVGERFGSAEEADAAECLYFARMKKCELLDRCPLWPLPTLTAERKVEHLTAAEREQLSELFGVTEEEYRQLYEDRT